MDWAIFWSAAGVAATVAATTSAWLIERQQGRLTRRGMTLEGADWVLDKGISFPDLARRLIRLDHSALKGLTEATTGTPEAKGAVFAKSWNTWSLVIRDDAKIVGYWCCYSLSSRLITKLEQGLLNDGEISAPEVRELNESGEHSLYFEMLGVHGEFMKQRLRVLWLLIEGLVRFADQIANDGIRIKAIYATGYSRTGAQLCEAFELTPLKASQQGGYVYRTTDPLRTLAILHALWAKRRRSARTILPPD